MWLALILPLTALLLKRTFILGRIGLLCWLLSLPMLGSLINEFRPDLAWGLLTGLVACLMATKPVFTMHARTLLGLGALVGLAMVSKPTGFPGTTAVIGTAYLVSLIFFLCSRAVDKGRVILKTMVNLSAGASIPVLPILVTSGPTIWAYLRFHMLEHGDVWRADGTVGFHLQYYIRDKLLNQAVGEMLLVILGAILATGLIAFFNRREATERDLQFWFTTLVVLIVAYAIPTATPTKQPYVGGLFYGTLIFVGLWNVSRLVQRLYAYPRSTFVGLNLVAIAFWAPTPAMFSARDNTYRAINAANATVLPVVERVARLGNGGPPPKVMFVSPGPAYLGTIEYLLLQKGLNVQLSTGAFVDNLTTLTMEAMQSTVVIIPETGAWGSGGNNFKSLKFQDRIIALLEADPKFRVAAAYKDPSGYRTFAFERVRVENVELNMVSGFGQAHGPFPQWELPVVRWMIAPQARVEVDFETDDEVNLPFAVRLRCRGDVPVRLAASVGTNKTETLIAAGEQMTQFDVSVPTASRETVIITLNAQPLKPLAQNAMGPLLCESPFRLVPNTDTD